MSSISVPSVNFVTVDDAVIVNAADFQRETEALEVRCRAVQIADGHRHMAEADRLGLQSAWRKCQQHPTCRKAKANDQSHAERSEWPMVRADTRADTVKPKKGPKSCVAAMLVMNSPGMLV